jgi:hypothetical protein
VQVSAAIDGVQVRFTGASATAAARYAGRTLSVACEPTPPPGPLLARTGEDERVVLDARVQRAAEGTLALRTRSGDPLLAGSFDVCSVPRPPRRTRAVHRGPFLVHRGEGRPALARVALTPAGARWVDELAHVQAVSDAAERFLARPGGYPPSTAPLPAGVVALPDPGAAPTQDAVGYWSDGDGQASFVALSAAGRRLVEQDLGGGMWRTNVTPFIQDIVSPQSVWFEQDPAYDRDPTRLKREPIPVGPGEGVRAAAAGRVLRMRFTGAAAKAARRVAGRRLTVLCADGRAQGLDATNWDSGLSWARGRVSRRDATLRVVLHGPGRPDLCAVSDDGASVAYAGTTPAGRDALLDVEAVGLLYGAWELVPEHATRYPDASALVAAHRKARLVALPTAGAAAPTGRVGVWSDGARALITTRSRSGHVLVAADEGDGLLRTNMYGSSALLLLVA